MSESSEEQWLPVNDGSGYFASSHGRILSPDRDINIKHPVMGPYIRHHRGRVLSPIMCSNGYMRVCLPGSGSSYVHQLVSCAFFGEIPRGLVCDHINGDRLNNEVNNLRYVSISVNCINRHAIGATRVKSGKWQASIVINGKYYTLGSFPTKHEATKAHHEARARYISTEWSESCIR